LLHSLQHHASAFSRLSVAHGVAHLTGLARPQTIVKRRLFPFIFAHSHLERIPAHSSHSTPTPIVTSNEASRLAKQTQGTVADDPSPAKMTYFFYSLAFLTLITGTVLYLTRARWLESFQATIVNIQRRIEDRRFPGSSILYSRLPSSFSGDAEAGLSSSNFDLTGNVEAGDSRAGLDSAAKREILRIMQRRRLKFDEARRVYMEQRFRDNGIGADGRPRDPKFVSFS